MQLLLTFNWTFLNMCINWFNTLSTSFFLNYAFLNLIDDKYFVLFLFCDTNQHAIVFTAPKETTHWKWYCGYSISRYKYTFSSFYDCLSLFTLLYCCTSCGSSYAWCEVLVNVSIASYLFLFELFDKDFTKDVMVLSLWLNSLT